MFLFEQPAIVPNWVTRPMAPVPGPCMSEPTLRVGFCTVLYILGTVARHSLAGKKRRIPRRGARLGGCTPPRPPKKKSNRKKREKRLERLFFQRFFRFSTVDSGVPEPPQREKSGVFSTFPILPVENGWEFLRFLLCKEGTKRFFASHVFALRGKDLR